MYKVAIDFSEKVMTLKKTDKDKGWNRRLTMTKKMIRTKTNYAENTKIMTIMIDDEKDEKRGLLSTKTYDDDKEDWWWKRKPPVTKKTDDDRENWWSQRKLIMKQTIDDKE